MEKIIENIFNNKIIIIIISVFLIASLMVYGIIKINGRNYNYKKIEKSKYIVYTRESNEANYYIQDIPSINLKGKSIEIINQDIDTYLNNFKKDNIDIYYEYNINGIILSLILIVEDHSKIETATLTYYRAYNININTLELLSNKSVLDYFNVTEQDVSNKLERDLKTYYKDLVNNSIIKENECNYKCFLESRDINSNNYIDNIEYFIRNGELIAFKPIVFIPLFDKEKITSEFIIK